MSPQCFSPLRTDFPCYTGHMKCQATTKSGKPCRNEAVEGSRYCRYPSHAAQDQFGFNAAAKSIPPHKQSPVSTGMITPSAGGEYLPPEETDSRVLIGNPKSKNQPCPKCGSFPCVRKSRTKTAAFYRCRNNKCGHRFGIREGKIVSMAAWGFKAEI